MCVSSCKSLNRGVQSPVDAASAFRVCSDMASSVAIACAHVICVSGVLGKSHEIDEMW